MLAHRFCHQIVQGRARQDEAAVTFPVVRQRHNVSGRTPNPTLLTRPSCSVRHVPEYFGWPHHPLLSLGGFSV